jgi:hypothetical protein
MAVEIRDLFPGVSFDLILGSPPCQSFSSLPKLGVGTTESKELQLIDPVRIKWAMSGAVTAIENVAGAIQIMQSPTVLRGTDFGLRVTRARAYETNFSLVNELVASGKALRLRCCLGGKIRFPRLDRLGRKCVCCKSNVEGVYSTLIHGATLEGWQEAMGISWMDARGLALSIPPKYGQYVIGQMVAEACRRKGAPVFEIDQVRDNTSFDHELRLWERSSGTADEDAGVYPSQARVVVETVSHTQPPDKPTTLGRSAVPGVTSCPLNAQSQHTKLALEGQAVKIKAALADRISMQAGGKWEATAPSPRDLRVREGWSSLFREAQLAGYSPEEIPVGTCVKWR